MYAQSGPKPPMQRCPYIHEMRERFINDTPNQAYIMSRIDRERDRAERENLLGNPRQSSAFSDASSNQVGTVVKVWSGWITRSNSTTSYTRTYDRWINETMFTLLLLLVVLPAHFSNETFFVFTFISFTYPRFPTFSRCTFSFINVINVYLLM